MPPDDSVITRRHRDCSMQSNAMIRFEVSFDNSDGPLIWVAEKMVCSLRRESSFTYSTTESVTLWCMLSMWMKETEERERLVVPLLVVPEFGRSGILMAPIVDNALQLCSHLRNTER